MLAIVQALSGLGAWVSGLIVAKWGYKVALVAAVVSVYVAIFAAMVAAFTLLIGMMPATPLSRFTLQFFPSVSATSSALAAYFGTMITLRSLDFWRLSTGLAAKIGA